MEPRPISILKLREASQKIRSSEKMFDGWIAIRGFFLRNPNADPTRMDPDSIFQEAEIYRPRAQSAEYLREAIHEAYVSSSAIFKKKIFVLHFRVRALVDKTAKRRQTNILHSGPFRSDVNFLVSSCLYFS